MRLSSVDTTSRVACYNLELSSGSSIAWVLGSFNIAAFYDAGSACYLSDRILLDSTVYRQNVQSEITSTNQSTLPYRDSLGFLRINLDALDRQADFDTLRQILNATGDWAPIAEICFDLKFDNILDPNTCFSLNFNTPDLQVSLNVTADVVTENSGGNVFVGTEVNQVENIIPDRSRNSCFVLYENTPELCSDGIDNDENGLTDCLDTEGCSPGNVSVTPPTLNCTVQSGDFVFSGTRGGQYSIDGGENFSLDSIIQNVGPGTYNVIVQRNGVVSCAWSQPIVVPQPECENTDQFCSDGIDNDQDGLIDCDDPECMPLIQDIIVNDPDNCPDLNNGEIMVIAGVPNHEISIDSGETFALGTFQNLLPGSYNIALINPVSLCQVRSNATLNEINCMTAEVCSDGIDNDMNGLVDCEDPICQDDPACDIPTVSDPNVYIANALTIGSASNNSLTITTENSLNLDIESFEVYDRWGNKMHDVQNSNTGDPAHGWTGAFNGQEVQSGVYFYRAVLNSGNERFTFSGDVTVIQ